jgi:hypothetical protein
MLNETKKLPIALKILAILQEEDLPLEECDEILQRTLAMLHAWHAKRQKT